MPQSVVISFYVGAAVLVITSLFTIFRVHEYDPETYARYHGIKESDNKEGGGWIELLKKAPKVFWQVSLVQFSAGFHSNTFQLMQLVRLRKTYGTPLPLLQQATKLQVTGSAY